MSYQSEKIRLYKLFGEQEIDEDQLELLLEELESDLFFDQEYNQKDEQWD